MTTNNLFFWGLVLSATACGLPVLGAELPAVASSDPPLVAYLYSGKLYCLHVQERFGEPGPPKPMELWQAKLTLEGPLKKEKQLVQVTTAYERLPDRWRVSHGFFWWLGDHTSHDSGSGDIDEVMRIPFEKVSTPIDKEFRWFILVQEWGMTIGLVDDLRSRHRLKNDGNVPGFATKDAYFDVIPDSKDEFHLLLAWRGEIRIWRGVLRWRDRDKSPDLKGRKDMPKKLPDIKWDNDRQPNLRVRTDMREPFLAYQDKTHFFFVTVSGKVYACRKRGEKQRTELLWHDARSPIRTVIHDTTSQKTFAFSKAASHAEKAGRDVCFELAPKLEPRAYDPKKIPELKAADPLPTMMEYARILLREKKVKAEE